MMIGPLVKQLALSGLMNSVRHKTARSTAGAGIYLVAGSVGMIGVVFLVISLYALLLESYAVPAAAAMTGAGVLGLSVLIGSGGTYLLKKKGKIVAKKSHTGIQKTLDDLFDGTLSGLDEPVRDNPKMALLLAGLAGYMAGDRLN